MQNPLYCPLLLGATRWLGHGRDNVSWFIHEDYLNMFFDMAWVPIFKRNDVLNYMCDAGHLQSVEKGYIWKEKEGRTYILVPLETITRFIKCCMYGDLRADHFKLFCWLASNESEKIKRCYRTNKLDIKNIPAETGLPPSVESEKKIMDMLNELSYTGIVDLATNPAFTKTELKIQTVAVRSIGKWK